MIGLRGIPARATGVEQAVEELAVRLAQRGHGVTVYGRRRYTEGLTELRGVTLRDLPAIYSKHLEAISHTALSVADALRRRFDIVHFHALGPSLLAAVPRLGGARTVVTVQGLDWRRGKWGPFARFVLRAGQSAAARLPDQTIVVSRALLKHFAARYPRGHFTYVPNGAPALPRIAAGSALESLGLAPRRFVLSLSRLVPEKGVHTLIEAFRRTRTDLRLVVVGGGSYSNRYVGELRRSAAGDPRIVFAGPLYGNEKAELLDNALLYVNPSVLEGLSLALLEALSAGVPVVVSDIAENLEPVTTTGGERLGLAFRAGDAGSLTTVLEDALGRPAEIAALAERAAAHVRRAYDWETITDQTLGVYRRALEGR